MEHFSSFQQNGALFEFSENGHILSCGSEFQKANTNTNLIACVVLCAERGWQCFWCALFFSSFFLVSA